jgi:hypothetical protein
VKRIISVLLVFTLVVSLRVPVFADDIVEENDGFSIEELPAFEEEIEVTFSDDEPESVEPTTDLDSTEEITTEEELLENQPETLPEDGDAAEDTASPDPDTAQEKPEQSNLPVIITAVVLAVAAIAVLLLKKRKTLGDRK